MYFRPDVWNMYPTPAKKEVPLLFLWSPSHQTECASMQGTTHQNCSILSPPLAILPRVLRAQASKHMVAISGNTPGSLLPAHTLGRLELCPLCPWLFVRFHLGLICGRNSPASPNSTPNSSHSLILYSRGAHECPLSHLLILHICPCFDTLFIDRVCT